MEAAQPVSFGDALRRARLAAGLTQEELAEQSSISVRTIGNLERGPQCPRRDTRRLLAEALGLDALREGQPAGARQPNTVSAAAAASVSGAREIFACRLPLSPTSLIGREQEVLAACTLLRRPEVRLLTLCGPPGVGKTRLALEVASQLQPEFADGAVFVSLAPLREPGLVASAIAQALGLHESSPDAPTERLQQDLQRRSLLLLLDNFEQVAAAAPLVAELRATCPQLKILVTSRSAVHVRGEQEFPLLPLALPDLAALPPPQVLARIPAVALLLERAQAVLPSFALTPANAPSIAAICHRLDGLPLALELAAARLKLFSPQMLLAQLEQRRLSLTSGPADLPKRQQALRDALAWSYDLLQPDEQALFRRLAVFVGGCPLEAVEQVCGASGARAQDTFQALAALLDHHLLRREEVAGSGEVRLGMLEIVREYALEQLQAHDEVSATQRAYAHYYLNLVETAGPAMMQAQQTEWFARLAREQDNIRVTLQWVQTAGEVELGLRLSGAFYRFWYTRGSAAEGRHWLETFIAQTRPEAPVRQTECWGKALNGAGALAVQQGDYEQAEQYHREDVSLCRMLGIRNGVAAALNNLGIALLKQEKFAETITAWEESLALAQAMGDGRRVALTLNNLGYLAYAQGQYRGVAQVYAESLAVRRHLEDAYGVASTLENWGQLAREQGEYAAASAFFEEAFATSRTVGWRQGMATTLAHAAGVAYDLGNLERAETRCAESLAVVQEGDAAGLRAGVLSLLGKVASQRGDYGQAEALQEECLALRQRMRDRQGIAEALVDLGQVAQVQGVYKCAASCYREALEMYQALRTKHRIAPCLEGVAQLAVAQQRAEAAARLLGAASALRNEIGAPLPPVVQDSHRRLLTAIQLALGDERFPTAWAAGQAMPFEGLLIEAIQAVGVQQIDQEASIPRTISRSV